jgi:hypothetical protein
MELRGSRPYQQQYVTERRSLPHIREVPGSNLDTDWGFSRLPSVTQEIRPRLVSSICFPLHCHPSSLCYILWSTNMSLNNLQINKYNKSKAVPLHVMVALGGRGAITPTHFLLRHYMGVSGQRHAPAALYPRGKDSLYPLYRRLGGPQSRSGHRG